MSTQALLDAGIYVGQYDLSGDHNALALTYGVDLKDASTFGSDARKRAAGLKVITASGEGFWSGGDGNADDATFSQLGAVNVPVTITPATPALNGDAYLFRAARADYSPGAQDGELLRFSTSLEGSSGDPLLRGNLLHVGSEASTGTETGEQLGALIAGQTLYAALHVISVAGTSPTLDVAIESDDNSGFTSATSRIAFTQATAITSEWKTVAGAITDDWWRVTFTIGGTGSPSFSFIVSVGIL